MAGQHSLRVARQNGYGRLTLRTFFEAGQVVISIVAGVAGCQLDPEAYQPMVLVDYPSEQSSFDVQLEWRRDLDRLSSTVDPAPAIPRPDVNPESLSNHAATSSTVCTPGAVFSAPLSAASRR